MPLPTPEDNLIRCDIVLTETDRKSVKPFEAMYFMRAQILQRVTEAILNRCLDVRTDPNLGTTTYSLRVCVMTPEELEAYVARRVADACAKKNRYFTQP